MSSAKSRRPVRDLAQPRQAVAQIAEERAVHQAFAWFRANEALLSRWQMEVTRIPAPPFGEAARAQWLKTRFQELGLQEVEVDEAGNVTGIHAGASSENPLIALTAHMDTVFPAGTPLEIRPESGKLLGPGISDNGSGLTALLATAAALQASALTHASPLLFIANVGEEGEGDLRGMRHIFSSPRWKDSIAYTLIVDGAGIDTLVTRALGSRRFEVTVRGKGGHSWSDFGEPNPIALLSRAIADFYKTEIPANSKRRSAYNVGVIRGGTSVNSIPESASMRVDLRSELAEEVERLENELRRCLANAVSNGAAMNARTAARPEGPASAAAVQCDIRRIGDRPCAELAEDAHILQVVKAVDQHLAIRSRPHCASTDANIPLSQAREAITIGAGGNGGGAHTLNEWFDPAGRDLGLKRILLALLTLAE
ncbi:MAG TPA: M20/M25/M40 family metallo-hydrolase [Terriglobales bacterium]|jgi:tripeptide aminopeptidase|nr:M20/M25/M40 family metallo-hydrolase [Terriglobales bacterium]